MLIEALGRRASGPGRVYVVGGASAVLYGWRDTTVDVDIKLDPEPGGVFEAIRELKDELDLNVELAAPDDFIPALPGWQGRSPYIATDGEVDFYHYDFLSQALAKIERGHSQDVEDVRHMVESGLVDSDALMPAFTQIEPLLARYPAIDAAAFRRKVIKARSML